MAYAEDTKVSFDKSMSDIRALVRKHGAQQFMQGEDGDEGAVQFRVEDRMVRFRLDCGVPEGRKLDPDRRRRQRARALLLVIKAKLESIESGIETFEEAFLANVVMSDGRTVYERVRDPIRLEYDSGKMPDTPWLLEGPK